MSTVVLAPTEPVWLCPRPLARLPGRFPLVPLLPHRSICKPLPPEFLFASYDADATIPVSTTAHFKLHLLLVTVLPIYYEYIQISSLHMLVRLTARIQDADRQWDSIRRIPYSAPGRWVQTLDMDALRCSTQEETLVLDDTLNQLLPLVPFLNHLVVHPYNPFSRRVLSSITYRDGVENIRTLRGIQLPTSPRIDEDAFLELLRACSRLEELEIVGTGVNTGEAIMEYSIPIEPPTGYVATHLPHLRKVAALSMPSSPTLFALLHSELPSLRHLTLTPYDEVSVPTSLVPRIIAAHGSKLTSLHLYTLKQWPTILFPSPPTLLEVCPNLRHASLELPLPTLTMSNAEKHSQLEIISIPRPKQDFWLVLERLLPKLPRLRFVRARDVKWLGSGMSDRARQAGVQGEMLIWRRRLTNRGIQLLDTEWKAGTG
ncbi:uncharacterized protein BXZ73DRAFT_86991 [Epithele typhae]|uniref:uncharacterized protein n=1 Tax=Epithele typhae TaxID=378194 RepID=UPI0020075D9B|nr:uncharacterized protein BXZ73DRAFT_86991 [Epithele typhae]KAH9944013.1 hypothetical protein BXZ73DRAFT_86991 [Epithele typhae]